MATVAYDEQEKSTGALNANRARDHHSLITSGDRDRAMAANANGWKRLEDRDDDENQNGEIDAEARARRDKGNNINSDGGIVQIEMHERSQQQYSSAGGPADIMNTRDGGGGGGAADGRAGGTGREDGGASTAIEYKVYKRRWFGLVQLTLLNVIISWDWIVFAPVANHAAVYFNTTETTVNWLSTCFLFAFAAISPLVIYLLHLGPKHAIVTSSALTLVGVWIRYGGCHSSSGGKFGVVMFGQILIGLGQPFVLSAPSRYSDMWFTNRGRVAATALSSLANPFGAAVGQLVVPFWVSKPSDVSRMILYMSIISSVCVIPSFFIPSRPPTPSSASSVTTKLSIWDSAVRLFKCPEFFMLFFPFAVYVGLFNSISSLLNQILLPHGYSEEEAGIAGALLIVVGLVAAAITSPIIDKTKSYLLAIRIAVPLIGLSYLVFVWMPETRSLAGPYLVMAVLGAASFSLVPVVIEFMVELTHPASPEVTSTLAWSGGQVLGGIFIIVSGALKGKSVEEDADMKGALIFSAVMGLVAVPLPLMLGLFGRGGKLELKRVRSDEVEGVRVPVGGNDDDNTINNNVSDEETGTMGGRRDVDTKTKKKKKKDGE